MRGIDPLEIPCYRFYNIALYSLREDRSDEQLEALNATLKDADLLPTPIEIAKKIFSPKQLSFGSSTTTKKEYVPPWWRGETVNAKVAMNMMKTLPKG